jgi:hypothetical protein
MEGESLDSSVQQSTTERPAPAQASTKEFVFPLSYAQQRLWLLDRLLPTGSVYNVPKVYRVSGVLKVDALRSALDELVERHESLRTRFGFEDGSPVQVIAAKLRLGLEVDDLTGARRGGARGRGAAARAGGGADTVRSGARAAAARAASAVARAGALAAADAAPHHHRRVVVGACLRASSRSSMRAHVGASERVAGAAGAVRRLRGVAAGVAAGGGAGAAACVLEAGAAADLPSLELPTDRPRPADRHLPRRANHLRARRKR